MASANIERLTAQATDDLARRMGVSASEIALVGVEEVEWRDSSLGLARPGMMYAQVITPGLRVVLEANGKEYAYHSDGRRIFLCERK